MIREDALISDTRYHRGIRLFNDALYFESHEVLEEIWTSEHGPARLFLQALIHFAAGLHHYERNNPDGARRQMRKALKKLAGYLSGYAGLNTEALYRDGIEWRDAIIEGRRIDGPRRMRAQQALQSQMQ